MQLFFLQLVGCLSFGYHALELPTRYYPLLFDGKAINLQCELLEENQESVWESKSRMQMNIRFLSAGIGESGVIKT